jgi:hypothetical protein
MSLTHRLAARPLARPLAALLALFVLVLGTWSLAAPARADTKTANAIAGLKHSKVYKDPEGSATISPSDVDRLNAAIGDAPIYLMIMPLAPSYEQRPFMQAVINGVHQKGTYAATFGESSGYATSDTIKGAWPLFQSSMRGASSPVNGLLAFVANVKKAGGGTSHAGLVGGLVVLGLVIVVGLGLFLLVRTRRRRQQEQDAAALAQLRTTVDEDITAFGEELDRIGFDPSAPTVSQEMRQDYTNALNSYDKAKSAIAAARRPADVQAVTAALEEGRFALATLAARTEGRALPERRPPCFFDPRHGPSVEDVNWTPPGGMSRPVPACAADATRIKDGLDPMTRTVAVGGEQRPYWDAGPTYAPWAGGYFGGYGGGGLLPGLLVGTMLGSMLSGPHYYGPAGGGWVDGGDWGNGGDGGNGSFTDGFSGGGGDFGNFDWGGGGDSGGGGDWGGGGDFGGGGGSW